MKNLLLALALLGFLASSTFAEVTRVDVSRREDVGASGYEKIVGTIHSAAGLPSTSHFWRCGPANKLRHDVWP